MQELCQMYFYSNKQQLREFVRAHGDAEAELAGDSVPPRCRQVKTAL